MTFRSYGSGSKPIIKNPGGGQWGDAVRIFGSWIIVDGLTSDSAGYGGFHIFPRGDHNIIRDCEAMNVGIGVPVFGRYSLVMNNYVHRLHSLVNKVGGNREYGAVGIWLFNSRNEVSYNRLDS